METIWHEHRDELKAFIMRRVKSLAEAEDILQDVSLKMLSSLNAHTRVVHPRAWLFAIARNAVVDHFRNRRPLDPLPEDLTGHCPDSGSGPLEEIGNCLAPMLSALPPKIREAIVLADLEGVKQRQVSERLGISLAAVKSRILRGRTQMRRMIEDCCHLELDSRGSIMDFTPKAPGCPGCADNAPARDHHTAP
nr:RNA polymerase sigma factor SigZ [Fundidesulfovibrio terrae]